jgi:hypothetical protein
MVGTMFLHCAFTAALAFGFSFAANQQWQEATTAAVIAVPLRMVVFLVFGM